MTVDIDRLLAELSDETRTIPIARLYELSGLDHEEIERFSTAWPRVPVNRRRKIISHLVEIAEANFEADFDAVCRACLDDEDEFVRAQAIEGLWESEDIKLIRPLLTFLREDPSVIVRAAAATSLGRFVLLGELEKLSPKLANDISEALWEVIHSFEEDVEVRRRAIESLAYSSDEAVAEVIADAYADEDRLMQVSAVFAMGRSADPRWKNTVLQELTNPDPEMRYEAARACGALEVEEAIPYLRDMAYDSDREIQEVSIWALGQIGGAEARRILEACYEDADDILGEVIEDALGELALRSGEVDFLLYSLDENDWADEDDWLVTDE
ncbi:MAG: HEAT repeat domain-containing protein [Anaerolineae bacterium]|jgi:HEAT repeat protein|nr:HEAT repeat domain-containing protein [Anaerolineae bacterium]MDH7474214.1 HEAT repeat domain-containing protein [Anaerolineae bacterium]